MPAVTRRTVSFIVLLGVAVLALALLAAPAGALRHHLVGPFGAAAEPTFGAAGDIEVIQGSGEVLVIDRSAQTISRFNADGTPSNFSALGTNVIDGQGPGDETPQGGISFGNAVEAHLAVDESGGPTDGNIYVPQPGTHGYVDIFAGSGSYLGQLTAAGGEEFGETCGAAVDPDGNFYVGDYSAGIQKFSPSANPPINSDHVATFPEGKFTCELAAGRGSTAGSIFASRYNGVAYKLNAESGELQYTIADGSHTNIKLNAETGEAYVTDGSSLDVYDVSGEFEAIPTSTLEVEGTIAGIAVDNSSGNIYLAREGDPKLVIYGPALPAAPVFESQSITSVVFDEAVLAASINPEGLATTYRVEYGLDESYESSTSEFTVGSDDVGHPVSVRLSNLLPHRAYHFRFVATNSLGSTMTPDRVFHTNAVQSPEGGCGNEVFRSGPSARLPNCRAYEMVSPVDKNGGDILTLIEFSSNPAHLDQASLDGEKLAFTSAQAFGNAQGAPYVSQFIANRTGDGWRTDAISTPQGVSAQPAGNRVDLEYRHFTPDLCSAVLLNSTNPPLAPGAPEYVPNLYQRQLCGTDSLRAVTTLPHGGDIPNLQGVSDDGDCVVFQLQAETLYESCLGQPLREIAVLPNGEVAPEASAAGGFEGAAQIRAANYLRNLSSDGSRVYWKTPDGSLYMRLNTDQEQSAVNGAGECTEPSKACTVVVTDEGDADFYRASPDGDTAIYSRAGALYRFDIESGSTFLAPGFTGIMGVSADATRVYFLSTAELNGEGVSGEPNLYYLDSDSDGPNQSQLVATLKSKEFGDFGVFSLASAAYKRTSRVTPDGLHAVFTARSSLTGYDNTDRSNGKADSEVFAYDVEANGGEGKLSCVSCNPSGQRPKGVYVEIDAFPKTENWVSGYIPPYSTSFYGPRAITDDGRRIFFNSADALLPSDTNGRLDVYQWEAVGATCTEQRASFSAQNDGCLSLISSGESPSDSAFVDADPSGANVFFTTISSLVPQDPGQVDIYNARELGGFPAPPSPVSPCEGEACQGPPASPELITPGSESYRGPGNVTRKRCGKSRVLRKGRCVRKGKKHKRAANNHQSKKTQSSRGNAR